MSDWFRVENVDEIPSPALLVYPRRVRANLQRMVESVGDPQRLRPHVKTHKMARVIQLKRQLGIDKFKTATIAEAEMTAREGGRDILLAYQPCGPNIERLCRLCQTFPDSRFSTLVDNLDSLESIAAAARQHNLVIDLYVDLNVGMNRTGIVPGEAALELYRRLVGTEGVRAAGLHAYDGHLHDDSLEQLRKQVGDAFAPVWQLRAELLDRDLDVPNLIASGTPTCQVHAANADIEVGPGTAVFYDFGQESLSPNMGFEHAAVLLTRVISRPAKGLICVDLGHKAVASEMPHPRVRFFGLETAEAVTHSEEHLVLRVENDDDFPVGTPLYGIPQHICPTVALHQLAWCIEEGRLTETWPVTARDRRLTI